MAEKKTVFNHDILFLVDMCNRFVREVIYSQSNGVTGMTGHDQERMSKYIQALNVKMDWIEENPLLDLPETHPRAYEVDMPEPSPNVESEVCNQFVRLIEAFRTEALNCQSARYASTVIAPDIKRFRAVTAKMESFLTTYVAQVEPVDLPESSPSEELSGPGFLGTNP
jgi:hypothetical protein